MTTDSEPGILPHRYWMVQDSAVEQVEGEVIEEGLVTIFVNVQELATIMCTPLDQEALALGFLFNEGIIRSIDEVHLIKANVARTAVDVFLRRASFDPPRRILLASSCGGNITFQYLTEAFPPLETAFATHPQTLFSRMKDLHNTARLYTRVRGVHTSILADESHLLLQAEDVGRHNTLDKIAGKAIQAHIDTRDCILMTSGRISSEMLGKARKMGVPVVVSHSAPTSFAVRLAQAWNICVVGYIREDRMRVYTHPQRLGLPAGQESILNSG
jgi:FdhD protein